MHLEHDHSVENQLASVGPGALHATSQADWKPGKTALPIVSAEVVGPEEVNVGQPAPYAIVVANLGDAPMDNVQINVTLPEDARVKQIHPLPMSCEGTRVRFQLERLAPKSRNRLEIDLIPQKPGPIALHADVHFSTKTGMETQVRLPELAVFAEGPGDVMLGDAVSFKVVVENRGDGPAEDVTIHQMMADGPAGGGTATPLGRLGPGEKRELHMAALVQMAGRSTAVFKVTAPHCTAAETETSLHVTCPRLEVEIHGPEVCLLRTPGVFAVNLSNSGDAAVTHVEASMVIPQGVEVAAFDRPVHFDPAQRIVRWRVPVVEPGGSQVLRMKAAPSRAEVFTLECHATAAYGVHGESKRVCQAITASGSSFAA